MYEVTVLWACTIVILYKTCASVNVYCHSVPDVVIFICIFLACVCVHVKYYDCDIFKM